MALSSRLLNQAYSIRTHPTSSNFHGSVSSSDHGGADYGSYNYNRSQAGVRSTSRSSDRTDSWRRTSRCGRDTEEYAQRTTSPSAKFKLDSSYGSTTGIRRRAKSLSSSFPDRWYNHNPVNLETTTPTYYISNSNRNQQMNNNYGNKSSTVVYQGHNSSFNNLNMYQVKPKCKWFLPENRRRDFSSTNASKQITSRMSSSSKSTSNSYGISANDSTPTNSTLYTRVPINTTDWKPRGYFANPSSSSCIPWWKYTTASNGARRSSVVKEYDGRLSYLGNDNNPDIKSSIRSLPNSCTDLKNEPTSNHKPSSSSSHRLKTGSLSPSPFRSSSCHQDSQNGSSYKYNEQQQSRSCPVAKWNSTTRLTNSSANLSNSNYSKSPFSIYGADSTRDTAAKTLGNSSSFLNSSLSSFTKASNRTNCLDTFYEMKSKYLLLDRSDASLNMNSCNATAEASKTRMSKKHDQSNQGAFHNRMSSCFMTELTRLNKISGIIKANTKSDYAYKLNAIVDRQD